MAWFCQGKSGGERAEPVVECGKSYRPIAPRGSGFAFSYAEISSNSPVVSLSNPSAAA